MIQLHDIDARERRRRERKIWRTGLLVSLLFHLVIFFGWRGNVIPPSPFAAAGPRAGDDRAAPGGMQVLTVRTPPTVPIRPPPVPLAVAVEVVPVEFDDMVELDPASVLGEEPGELEGPGLENGDGRGDGGNAEEGLFRLQPPTPRGMILPPSNDVLKETPVRVWVFVDERGRVVADSTRLEPPTRDRGFNRRLIEEAAKWVFRPAVQEGRPVAAWFPYLIGTGG